MLHFIVDFARGIIDLPKLNCEDLVEILSGGQGPFGVYYYMNTHYAYATAFFVYSIQVLVRMMIKFRITKEKEKEEDAIKRPQQNV